MGDRLRTCAPRSTRRHVIGALFVALVVSQGAAAHAAGAGQVDLRLWPAGQGRIDVAQGGSTVGSCDFLDVLANQTECTVPVTAGVPVTLAAVPEPAATIPPDLQSAVPDYPTPQTAFVRWSRYDCGSSQACTFTPETNLDWVTAVFTPLQLEVGINGQGAVGVRRADGGVDPLVCEPLDFGDTTCHGLFAADTDVTLVAAPANLGDPIHWGPGCRPDPGDASGARCIVTMSNLRTFAGVGFGDQVTPPDRPFQITPRIRVVRGGSGAGKVSGTGIDCGAACTIDVDFQERVSLEASAGAGSRFVRWQGVCSTVPRCAFAAGSATLVKALFEAVAAPGTPPPGQGGKHAVAFKPRLAKVAARGRGRHRVIVLVVMVDRPARAKVRLLKRRRTVATRRFALVTGRNSLRLRVPRSARRGTYRVSLKIVAGGESRTLQSIVRIRR
jgi:hypothetical protein